MYGNLDRILIGLLNYRLWSLVRVIGIRIWLYRLRVLRVMSYDLRIGLIRLLLRNRFDRLLLGLIVYLICYWKLKRLVGV